MNELTRKNNAKSSVDEILLEEGFILRFQQHPEDGPKSYHRELDKTYIQFHFCLNGNAQFSFNKGNYQLALKSEQSLLLFNTLQDLPIDVELRSKATLVSLLMTIRKFHAFFSTEAHYIKFLDPGSSQKKYYSQEHIPPAISIILSQLVKQKFHPSVSNLFYRGKALELLAYFFNRTEDTTLAQCPYMEDEDDVKRIRRAKDIIISRMSEPPRLPELARETGLSLKRLKSGFKQVYGTSVYGFLWEYKLDYARKLLETREYTVNDVGLRIGYSTASHFIAAFKKRYSTTPKKYLLSL